MKTPKIDDGTPCTYCGGIATVNDHVVSVELLRPQGGTTYYQEGDWVVPACNECNLMLSDRMLHTVPLRAAFLYKRYLDKYRKLRTTASWTDEEIEELKGTFKQLVIETRLIQAELDHRLAHLYKVKQYDSDYLSSSKL